MSTDVIIKPTHQIKRVNMEGKFDTEIITSEVSDYFNVNFARQIHELNLKVLVLYKCHDTLLTN